VVIVTCPHPFLVEVLRQGGLIAIGEVGLEPGGKRCGRPKVVVASATVGYGHREHAARFEYFGATLEKSDGVGQMFKIVRRHQIIELPELAMLLDNLIDMRG